MDRNGGRLGSALSQNRMISVVRRVGLTTAWLFNASINPVEILTVNVGS
jgi:hypothetical protein